MGHAGRINGRERLLASIGKGLSRPLIPIGRFQGQTEVEADVTHSDGALAVTLCPLATASDLLDTLSKVSHGSVSCRFSG